MHPNRSAIRVDAAGGGGACNRSNARAFRFRSLSIVAAMVVASGVVGAPQPANAFSDTSPADLQAIARSLGFLDSLPREGTITVGIVYAPGEEAIAARTAEMLNALQGPNSTTFKTQAIAVATLAQLQDHLDLLLIADGACTDPAVAKAIIDVVRRRRVVSISSDPACLETKCCVLMVHSNGKVDIVLDTALADAAGAHFSPVFAMMVKRK